MNTMTHTPGTIVHEEQVVTSGIARQVLAALRIMFGLTFLWAFFDKLLALGFSTGRSVNPETGVEVVDRFGDAAFINGGSPTLGFLKFGADGPFKGFYNAIAGTWYADWGFMIALLLIGLAFTFGAAIKLAGFGGALLYLMMWTVALPPANNPVLDEHLLGGLTMVALALVYAGDTWGVGKWWGEKVGDGILR
jgi:thiosulfate dehydrogenase (quinone) large subunit